VYLGNLDAFKGASISPDDRKPRGAAKKASTPRASAKQAAPKPPGAVGSGAASDADRYVITVTP
jgi:hypothetical protein